MDTREKDGSEVAGQEDKTVSDEIMRHLLAITKLDNTARERIAANVARIDWIERRLSDIEHAIEACEVGETGGQILTLYSLSAEMRVLRRERRSLKNENATLFIFTSDELFTQQARGLLDAMAAQAQFGEHAIYHPRT